MDPKQFKQHLLVITTGDQTAAREAGRAVQAALKWKPRRLTELHTEQYWAAVEGYRDITGAHNLTELVALLSIFAWELRSPAGQIHPRFALAADFAIYCMTHSNGTLRERSRKAADYFRVALMDPVGSEDTTHYASYIHRIESLIGQYRPPRYAPHVEDLKPSPFKTLIIHWYDLGGGTIGEQFVNIERAKELRLPIYSYWDDDWLEQSQPTPAETMRSMWQGEPAANIAAARQAMTAMETLAGAQLRRVLRRHQLAGSQITQIEDQARQHGTQAGVQALVNAINTTKRYPGDHYNPQLELHDAVRRIETRAAYAVGENDQGQPIAGFLSVAARAKAVYDHRQPEHWSEFLGLIYDGHRQLVTLERHLNELHKPSPRFAAVLPPEELASYSMEDHIAGLAEVSHYALDWWAMSEPWMIIKRTSSALAAIAWYISDRANPQVSWVSLGPVASFGGWKTAGSLYSAGDRAYSCVYTALGGSDALVLPPSLRMKP